MKTMNHSVVSTPLSSSFFRIAVGIAVLASLADAWGGLPAGDYTLQPVQTGNLPVVSTIFAYRQTEASMTQPDRQTAIYTPYDNRADAWWDNIVDELLQARLPVVSLTTCGTTSLNPTNMEGPGDLHPYRLEQFLAALERRGAVGVMKFNIFAQADAQSINRQYYGLPPGTVYDFANEDAWNQVWWLRIIKPWCDTVPQSSWHLIEGRLPIEFWGLGIQSLYKNQQGNVSRMLAFLDQQLFATYGVHGCFILGNVNYDTTLGTLPSAMGNNMWFSPTSTPFTMTPYKGKVWGGIAPGYIDPGYFDVNSPKYHDESRVLPRTGPSGTGQNGDSLKAGLEAAVANNAVYSNIEGWTNVSESNGLYRVSPLVSSLWSFPNQYINMIRPYTDLRSVTIRLEAEACDSYVDTTLVNSGGAFRRAPDSLDIRPLTGAPVISASSVSSTNLPKLAFDGVLWSAWSTGTSAPGWLQYDYGQGNSNVVTGYYLTSSTQTANRDPMNWELQGSNDGVNWSSLDIQLNVIFDARNETKRFDIVNNQRFQRYRLHVVSTRGGSAEGIAVGELKLLRTSSRGGGWAVTETVQGEEIRFRDVAFSAGNYRFPIRYSAVTAGRKVRLLVDGISLGDVTLPATGGADVFDTFDLGVKTLTTGRHQLTLQFLTGGIDVDWIFGRKVDPLMTLQSVANSRYVCAEKAGNDVLVANRTAVGGWEKISADDVNGGTLQANDVIHLQTANGLFLSADGGGGGALLANRRDSRNWEKFTIVRMDGGAATLTNGAQVALRSINGNYLTVGAGDVLNATAATIGSAQTFVITLSPQ